MDLNIIDCFMHIASGKTYEETAAAHYISTSSLSKSIKSLEKELGLKLFDRTGRSVKMTPEGKALYDALLPVHGKYLDAVNSAKNSAQHRDIVLFACPTFFSYDLTPSIVSLEEAYNIHTRSVSIRTKDAAERNSLLSENRCDFLFDLACGAPEGVDSIPLLTDDVVAICSPENALSTRSAISFDTAMELVSSGSCTVYFDGRLKTLLSANYPEFDFPFDSTIGFADCLIRAVSSGGIFFASRILTLTHPLPPHILVPTSGFPDFKVTMLYKESSLRTESAVLFKNVFPQLYRSYMSSKHGLSD